MAYLEGSGKISKEELQNKQSTLGKYPNSQVIISEPIELKWRGVTTQSTLIPPKTGRKFDAVYVYENSPRTVHLGINDSLVDYSGYHTTLNGPGLFELNFAIYT